MADTAVVDAIEAELKTIFEASPDKYQGWYFDELKKKFGAETQSSTKEGKDAGKSTTTIKGGVSKNRVKQLVQQLKKRKSENVVGNYEECAGQHAVEILPKHTYKKGKNSAVGERREDGEKACVMVLPMIHEESWDPEFAAAVRLVCGGKSLCFENINKMKFVKTGAAGADAEGEETEKERECDTYVERLNEELGVSVGGAANADSEKKLKELEVAGGLNLLDSNKEIYEKNAVENPNQPLVMLSAMDAVSTFCPELSDNPTKKKFESGRMCFQCGICDTSEQAGGQKVAFALCSCYRAVFCSTECHEKAKWWHECRSSEVPNYCCLDMKARKF